MRETIEKQAIISAPADKVWAALFDDETYRIWSAEFAEGSFAETDWQVGSEVRFMDEENRDGLVGKIITNEYPHKLEIEYTGEVENGENVFTSPGAKLIAGGHESYVLTSHGDTTELTILSDVADEFAEEMSMAWDEALVQIKELAEQGE